MVGIKAGRRRIRGTIFACDDYVMNSAVGTETRLLNLNPLQLYRGTPGISKCEFRQRNNGGLRGDSTGRLRRQPDNETARGGRKCDKAEWQIGLVVDIARAVSFLAGDVDFEGVAEFIHGSKLGRSGCPSKLVNIAALSCRGWHLVFG